MVELYPRCNSREISEDFQKVLETGWTTIFKKLQSLGVGIITELEDLEVSLLDDIEMARVHGEFLDDATPTDVITFDHGELLIGVETAARQAIDFGTSSDREIALYGIHGMLHLSGYDDQTLKDAQVMAARQDELFEEVFANIFHGK